MTLDLLHADAVSDDSASPPGSSPPAGPGASLHAMLAYREHAARERGVARPERRQARNGTSRVRQGLPPLRHRAPAGARSIPTRRSSTCDGSTSTSTTRPSPIIGSACNYGYGTVDPIDELSEIAVAHGVGLHVDGCLGGFILPFGEELGYEVPVFDFRVPGVTSISADTHKYGYALEGHVGADVS